MTRAPFGFVIILFQKVPIETKSPVGGVCVCVYIRAGVFRGTVSLCINTGILPAHLCGRERVYAGEALTAPRMGSASPTSISLVHLTYTDGWLPGCAW